MGYTIFSLMGKPALLRFSFLECVVLLQPPKTEHIKYMRKGRLPSSCDLAYFPQWDTLFHLHISRKIRCTETDSLELQFPHSSFWDPSLSHVGKRKVDTIRIPDPLLMIWCLGAQALEFEPLLHSSQQVLCE